MFDFDFADCALVVLFGAVIWMSYVISRLHADVVDLSDRVSATHNKVKKMQEKERAERRRALYTPKPPEMSTSRSNLVYHGNISDNDGYLGSAALGAVAGYGAATFLNDSDSSSAGSCSSGSLGGGCDFGGGDCGGGGDC